jgi:hypothetical protein
MTVKHHAPLGHLCIPGTALQKGSRRRKKLRSFLALLLQATSTTPLWPWHGSSLWQCWCHLWGPHGLTLEVLGSMEELLRVGQGYGSSQRVASPGPMPFGKGSNLTLLLTTRPCPICTWCTCGIQNSGPAGSFTSPELLTQK